MGHKHVWKNYGDNGGRGEEVRVRGYTPQISHGLPNLGTNITHPSNRYLGRDLVNGSAPVTSRANL